MTTHVVINASPLILLSKAGLEGILTTLFEEVIVPKGVVAELALGGENGAALHVPVHTSIVVKNTKPNALVTTWDLGRGESEVIAFALSHPRYTPVLDDAAAKACCKAFGINTLGTGSLLIMAKQCGALSSVASALSLLRNKGMWISDRVCTLLCEKADEKWART